MHHVTHLTDFVFSTAHKSKGLEFDSVSVCNDFLQGADLSSMHSLRKCVGEGVSCLETAPPFLLSLLSQGAKLTSVTYCTWQCPGQDEE